MEEIIKLPEDFAYILVEALQTENATPYFQWTWSHKTTGTTSDKKTKMKPFSYYSTPKTKFPTRQDYAKYYVYDKGDCLYEGVATKPYLKETYPDAIIQEVVDTEALQEQQRLYAEEESRLHEEFKRDIFDEFDVADNPKRELCFTKAWNAGHASGYRDVYNSFSDLVELIV